MTNTNEQDFWEKSSETELRSLFEMHSLNLKGELEKDSEEYLRLQKLQQEPLRPLKVKNAKMFFAKPQYWLSAMAIAACVVLIVNIRQGDDFAIKGASYVTFIHDHDGIKSTFVDAGTMQSGDKANAEILASESSIAFMGIFSRDGRLLSSKLDLEHNILRLEAGVKKYFPIAIELDGESDGEIMSVVVCKQTQFFEKYANPSDFFSVFESFGRSDIVIEKQVPFCSGRSSVLRN